MLTGNRLEQDLQWIEWTTTAAAFHAGPAQPAGSSESRARLQLAPATSRGPKLADCHRAGPDEPRSIESSSEPSNAAGLHSRHEGGP